MLVEEVGRVYVKGVLMTGPLRGRHVMIPRIKLHDKGSPCSGLSFYCYQFPLTAAYAMSINKAQGQTFACVGVYLSTDVLSHGQLYVTLS
jgi:ATP-dependent DNA helicase PIF1